MITTEPGLVSRHIEYKPPYPANYDAHRKDPLFREFIQRDFKAGRRDNGFKSADQRANLIIDGLVKEGRVADARAYQLICTTIPEEFYDLTAEEFEQRNQKSRPLIERIISYLQSPDSTESTIAVEALANVLSYDFSANSHLIAESALGTNGYSRVQIGRIITSQILISLAEVPAERIKELIIEGSDNLYIVLKQIASIKSSTDSTIQEMVQQLLHSIKEINGGKKGVGGQVQPIVTTLVTKTNGETSGVREVKLADFLPTVQISPTIPCPVDAKAYEFTALIRPSLPTRLQHMVDEGDLVITGQLGGGVVGEVFGAVYRRFKSDPFIDVVIKTNAKGQGAAFSQGFNVLNDLVVALDQAMTDGTILQPHLVVRYIDGEIDKAQILERALGKDASNADAVPALAVHQAVDTLAQMVMYFELCAAAGRNPIDFHLKDLRILTPGDNGYSTRCTVIDYDVFRNLKQVPQFNYTRLALYTLQQMGIKTGLSSTAILIMSSSPLIRSES